MRCIAGAVCVIASLAAAANAQEEGSQAHGERILNEARRALGGAAALAQVRSLRGTGRSTRLVGPVRLSADIELRLDRPGRYLRIDRVRLAGTAIEQMTGFDGDRFIQHPGRTAATEVSPGENDRLRAGAAAALRKELVLLLVGFFSAPFDDAPMRVEHAGAAESPDGPAAVIRLRLADGIEALLVVHPETQLPVLISWQDLDPLQAVREPALLAADSLPIAEHRLHFSDYRPVGGLRWPFVIRHSVGGQPLEEMRFDTFTVNPVFDRGAFAPGR